MKYFELLPVAALLAMLMFSSASVRAEANADALAAANSTENGQAMQSLDTSDANRPWAKGIPEDAQKKASQLFVEGNALLDDSSFREAAAKYGEALKLWDHPAIHYNLALALDILNDPVALREHLVAAMRYGEGPLGDVRMKYAVRSLQKVDRELAPIEISCNVQGAVVKLDHLEKFRGPGHYEAYVLPGDHIVEGTRIGFEPVEQRRTLLPGKPTKVIVQFYTEEQLIEKHNRWPFWIPVTVTAGGAALAGLGGIFLATSNSKLKKFDQQIAANPNCSTGCMPDPATKDLQTSGNHYKTAATITIATGAIAFTAGAVLTIFDIPTTKRLTPEEYEKKLQFQPSAGLGYVGLVGSGHFRSF